MKRGEPEPGPEPTAAETERLLLQNLEAEKESPREPLEQLVSFYKRTGQYEKAFVHLRRLVPLAPDVEAKAHYFLDLGQSMELAPDFPAAVRYYREGLSLKPRDMFVRYFLNNNLGFSLNTLGAFAEGEGHCRTAIGIDPGRPNGHKNLGIALYGQERYQDAAECFIAATEANAVDCRAYDLLRVLLADHPEVEVDLEEVARRRREALKRAGARNPW